MIKTKLYFPKRIPEPEAMGDLEMMVFNDLSKQNYRQWMIPLVDDALEKAKLRKGDILDVGCGPGLLVKELAERSGHLKITGLDISTSALRLAEKNCDKLTNVSFKLGRAEKLPFVDESFDLVVCKDSLHHFKDLKRVLGEMLRVLKSDGVLYLQDLRRDLPFYLLRRAIPPQNTLQKLQFYSARAAYTKAELAHILGSIRITRVVVRTKQITKKMKDRYLKLGLDIKRLRESFQARYVAVIKK